MQGESVERIPLMTIKAGPKDSKWEERLKEEYVALIEYIKMNQDDDNEWFEITPNSDSTKWKGKCWYYYNFQKYP